MSSSIVAARWIEAETWIEILFLFEMKEYEKHGRFMLLGHSAFTMERQIRRNSDLVSSPLRLLLLV
jgi:hypothetical protein